MSLLDSLLTASNEKYKDNAINLDGDFIIFIHFIKAIVWWIWKNFINLLKSAAFLLQTSENNLKPP